MENIFSPQISAYRKNYDSRCLLICLTEEWRDNVDKDFGTVLTDLSKTFGCILHDLSIAKLEVYVLGEKALSYIYSISQTEINIFVQTIKKVIFKRYSLVSLKAP